MMNNKNYFTNSSLYNKETGLPDDEGYLEKGLPDYLEASIENIKASWKIIDGGGTDIHWDLCWCDLSADINSAEINQQISGAQAWYLRKKYLRLEKEENISN